MLIPLQALVTSSVSSVSTLVFWIAPIAGVIAVLASLLLMRYIGKMSPGGPKAQEVGSAIREGAYAFLKRQYTTIAIITAVVFVLLWVALPTGFLGLGTAAAFLIGAVASLAAGYIAMDNATKANVRTVAAAKEYGAEKALKTAFYGGATMGMAVVGLSLLGVSFLFLFYGGYNILFNHLDAVTSAAQIKAFSISGIVGMGFGASLIALFAQLGGGIYTKAADVGADLVGKVEAGIPEDDPRNPAVIADNVGDNVGDSAGRGADLFESATGENIGGMIIGGLISIATGNLIFLVFPLIARALGIFSTLVGMPFVKLNEAEAKHPMKALRKGLMVTTIVSGVLFLFATIFLLGNGSFSLTFFYLYFCLLSGLGASVAIDYITDYYTGSDRGPVGRIARASQTGAATNIITGLAVGLETTALPIVSLVVALIVSYYFGTQFAISWNVNHVAQITPFIGGIYGTTLATMGMLAVMGMVLALDGFGPIADNAAGIAEMSGEGGAEETMEALDAVGNTTKALTKGFALGSALLAAQLLFQTYASEVTTRTGKPFVVDISNPAVLIAGFIGAMLPFFFSSQAISAVGKAASEMVEEVRRQFREIPGIMEGTGKPEYGKAVDISTKAALKGMVLPGLILVIVPIIVGVLLGPEAVGAFVIGATISAVPLALFMNTGGGAWDNAKKFIETGKYGGKGSPAHAAAVVGDTVGDPLKDTAGPSLHVLIKLLSTLSIVFIPLFINLLHLI
ncbi:MAG: sodium-translocating pyrophosphatase [Candidatus Bathyarchaeia archaeon]|jgi:K(+)-stimulated pyrophosphate-energized sodium pump